MGLLQAISGLTNKIVIMVSTAIGLIFAPNAGINQATPAVVVQNAISNTSQRVWQVNFSGSTTQSGSVRTDRYLISSPLVSCNTVDTTSTGVLVCGTDSGGDSFADNASWFVNDTGDTMTGKLIVDLTTGSDAVEIMQTLSGDTIFVTRNVTVTGTTSGGYLSARTFSGAGLLDCDADNQTVSWDSTSRMFGCGDDDNTGGLSYTDIDDSFVQVQGDTMTGGLLIQSLTNGTPASVQGGVLLEVAGVMSGRSLHAQDNMSSSGKITIDLFSGTDALEVMQVVSGSSLQIAGGGITMSNQNAVVFNENSLDADFRIEGDTYSSIFFIDASLDQISIGGVGSTTSLLEIIGQADETQLYVRHDNLQSANDTVIFANDGGGLEYFNVKPNGSIVINESAGSIPDFRIESDSHESIFVVDSGINSVLMGGLTAATSEFLFDHDSGIVINDSGSGSFNFRVENSGENMIYMDSLDRSIGFGGEYGSGAELGVKTNGDIVIDGAGSSAIDFVVNLLNADNLLFVSGGNRALYMGGNTQATSDFSFDNDTGIVINDAGSGSTDFRVESDTNANMIFVDASADFIGIGLAVPETALDVLGTISGSTINVSRNQIVLGTLSGGYLSARTFSGAGLSDCDTATTSKLLWDTTTRMFSCGTDTDTNTGISYADAASWFVDDAGDTMTGKLTVDLTTGTDAMEVMQIISGAQLRVAGGGISVTDSGTIVMNENSLSISDIRMESDANSHFFFLDSSSNTLFFGGSGATYAEISVADNGEVIINDAGGSVTDFRIEGNDNNEMFVTNAVTNDIFFGGSNTTNAEVHYDHSLEFVINETASGSFDFRVEGDTEPNLFFVDASADDVIINDGGVAAGTFRVESDTNANMLFVDGTNNRVGIGMSVPETEFDVLGTISGSSVNVSRNQIVLGTLSGGYLASRTFSGAGLLDCDTAATSKILWDATTRMFSCGTDQNTGGSGISYDDAASWFLNDTGDTSTGKLIIDLTTGTDAMEVMQTLSGDTLFVTRNITVTGTTSGGYLAARSFSGAGLLDCDTSATSKLLWDATSRMFSCGTDQNSGGSGISYDDANSWFLSDAGDTATGKIIFDLTTGVDAVEIMQTLSGTDIHGTTSLSSSGTLVVGGNTTVKGSFSGASLRVMSGSFSYVLSSFGVNTTTPKARLDVRGLMSGTSLQVSSLTSCAFLITSADGSVSCGSSLGTANGGTALTTLPTRTVVLSAGGARPSTLSGSVTKSMTFGTNNVDLYAQAFGDTSSPRHAQWTATMPDNYDGGTLTAKFYWTTTITTNDIKWFIQCRSLGDTEAIDQAFGSSGSVVDTAGAANTLLITSATAAITCAGTPAGGEAIQFRAFRTPADAADTLAGTGNLISVKLEYTTNSWTD